MKGLSLFRPLCGWLMVAGLLAAMVSRSPAQTTPPTYLLSVTIVAPTNGQTFTAPANIQITADLKDYGAYPDKIAFYDGTNLIISLILDPIGPSETNGLVVPVQYTWSGVDAGSYTLTAVASDTRGLTVTSAPVNITVTSGPPPVPTVTIVATHPVASAGDPGMFTVYRNGGSAASVSNSLTVFYSIGGTASNGVDYATLSNTVTIPAGASSAQITVTPISDPLPDPNETVVLQLIEPPYDSPPIMYLIGSPSNAVVTIAGNPSPPVVTIIATDPIASVCTNFPCFVPPTVAATYISGTNTATFLVRRAGDTNNDLTVDYAIGGTASNGVDYVTLPGYVTIPAGKRFALITIVPLKAVHASALPFLTVILALTEPPPPVATPPPYIIGWPGKAEAIILEDCNVPRPVMGVLPDASFHVCLPGTNGMNFCLQVSTNLIDWLPVCTNTVVKGSIEFVDPEACAISNRYYRAVPVPGPATY